MDFPIGGYPNPSKFFISIGLSTFTATTYSKGNITTLKLKHIKNLCEALNCTPNDLLEFIPNETQQKQLPNHPLVSLLHKSKSTEIIKLLNTLPYEKLAELETTIKQMK